MQREGIETIQIPIKIRIRLLKRKRLMSNFYFDHNGRLRNRKTNEVL